MDSTAGSLVEEYSFLIENLKMTHPTELVNLNIKVRYHFVSNLSDSAYPDFRDIAEDIQDFIDSYPEKSDYWEIINKKLTLLVLDGYSELQDVTSEMEISPSKEDPYFSLSVVTRKR
ncbi:MAG TPA: hypothetical protein VNH22_08765 [Blastocatellia bacterium]|jgi:hypothetical protein|nr:hypothetical protein [Blastocatellia bacterium]